MTVENLLAATILALTFIVLLAFARVSLMLILTVGGVTSTLGMFISSGNDESMRLASAVLAGSLICLLLGYWIGSIKRPVHMSRPPRSSKPLNKFAVYAVVMTAGGLACYHFLAAGIPLFSDAIEVDRFDFTSSGLFGVPGRMYLFGTQIAWVVASAAAVAAKIRWREYGPWVWATFFLALTSLLGGFKSGVIAFATVVVIAGTIVAQQRPRLSFVVRRYWPLAGLGALYYVAVSALYPTYAGSDRSVLDLFIDRVTVVSAAPKLIAIERSVPVPPGGVLADFSHFLSKYAGSDMPGYSVERAVSASIIGVDPSSSAWTTPVTIGGVPELVLFFGIPIALLASILMGVLVSRLYQLSTVGPMALISCAVVGLALNTWKSRGGIAYYTLNYLLVAAMLGLVYLAAILVIRAAARVSPKSRARRSRWAPVNPSPERDHVSDGRDMASAWRNAS